MSVPHTCSSKIWTHAHDIQRDACFYRSLLILKRDLFFLKLIQTRHINHADADETYKLVDEQEAGQ